MHCRRFIFIAISLLKTFISAIIICIKTIYFLIINLFDRWRIKKVLTCIRRIAQILSYFIFFTQRNVIVVQMMINGMTSSFIVCNKMSRVRLLQLNYTSFWIPSQEIFNNILFTCYSCLCNNMSILLNNKMDIIAFCKS